MPELAEVDNFRRRWDAGIGQRIKRVSLHRKKRIFRRVNAVLLARVLSGAILRGSQAHGKQMLFRFSKHAWLGIHLGMTGRLETAGPDFEPGRHDHLVLYQSRRALLLKDSRQ